jgi:hypothetical protein
VRDFSSRTADARASAIPVSEILFSDAVRAAAFSKRITKIGAGIGWTNEPAASIGIHPRGAFRISFGGA